LTSNRRREREEQMVKVPWFVRCGAENMNISDRVEGMTPSGLSRVQMEQLAYREAARLRDANGKVDIYELMLAIGEHLPKTLVQFPFNILVAAKEAVEVAYRLH
jgi:hypothetical protein